MRYALHLQRIHIHGRHSKFSGCSRERAWLLARNYRCVPGSIGDAACRIQKLFPDRRMTARRIRRTRSDALMLLPLVARKRHAQGFASVPEASCVKADEADRLPWANALNRLRDSPQDRFSADRFDGLTCDSCRAGRISAIGPIAAMLSQDSRFTT